jgi:hypothetical protein
MYHSLGVKADGSIVAWGLDIYGQCDVPSPNASFVAVAAGAVFSLGLKSDGSIVGWGDNRYDQCAVPPPNMGFVAVAAGTWHSLGLKADGSIVAWGNNSSGQCRVPSPNTGFVAIAAGERFSLGIRGSSPQAVYLARFEAERRGLQAMVHWEVSQPRDHAGFYLWRQESGSERVRLSQALLSGQTTYDFTDPAPPMGPADYWLQEVTTGGSENWYGPAHLEAAAVPSASRLYQNQPNPFNPSTTLRFDLPVGGRVRLGVYDVAGRLLRTLLDVDLPAGSHEAVWDGRDAAGRGMGSGAYFARLVAGGIVATTRMDLVK